MIASFDIGKCNFAFCIEKINPSVLSKIESIPKAKRYEKGSGICTPEFQQIIDSVCVEGELVLYKNTNLTTEKTKNVYLDDIVFVNMYKILEAHWDWFKQCSIILIEQQMSFGLKKINTMALKLAQHCKSYFVFKGMLDSKISFEIVEFPAYHKTTVLGAEKVGGKSMPKPARKKWTVEKTIDVLMQRGDIEMLDTISEHKKRDDLADVFTQLQAFKFLRYVAGEI